MPADQQPDQHVRPVEPGRTREPGSAHEPDGDLGRLVARVVDPGWLGDARREQGRALGALGRSLAGSARRAGRVSVLRGRWLADLMVDVAPRLPLRDAATLTAAHPGLTPDELADLLIGGAARATATIGAAGGALAAVEFTAPPTLLTAPAQIAAETVAVAAVEVKLIAELHQVYGVPAPGNARARALGYLLAWTTRRGLDPSDPTSISHAFGGTAKRALRSRMIRVAGRSTATMGPLLTGAVAGSMVNGRETRRIGYEVQADLRGRDPVPGRWSRAAESAGAAASGALGA